MAHNLKAFEQFLSIEMNPTWEHTNKIGECDMQIWGEWNGDGIDSWVSSEEGGLSVKKQQNERQQEQQMKISENAA